MIMILAEASRDTLTSGMVFWIVFIVSVLFGGWFNWGDTKRLGNFGVVMVLFFLLAWRVFGWPISG